MLRLLFNLCAPAPKRCSSALTFGTGSPVDSVKILGRQMYLKRDDLLALSSDLSTITGNKVRKLWSLYHSERFPSTIVSFGGDQSNAMRALALLCQHKGARFIYVVRDKGARPDTSEFGNLKTALQAGMQLVRLPGPAYMEVSDALNNGVEPMTTSLKQIVGDAQNIMFLPMGAGGPTAVDGIQKLSSELREFISKKKSSRPWKIIVSGGTGFTAYHLAQQMKEAKVLATPCGVRGPTLLKCLEKINARSGGEMTEEQLQGLLPKIEMPHASFGQLSYRHLSLWKSLYRDTGVEFDLVYAPRSIEVLVSQCNRAIDWTAPLPENALENLFEGQNIIYYHCGGAEGNEGQLGRYQAAGYFQ